MLSRELEDNLLMRCASAARSSAAVARDQKEANVFRVAAMVIQSRLPRESTRLLLASDNYFGQHPADRLPAADVVRNGWVFSLPRLRDMLSNKLQQR